MDNLSLTAVSAVLSVGAIMKEGAKQRYKFYSILALHQVPSYHLYHSARHEVI